MYAIWFRSITNPTYGFLEISLTPEEINYLGVVKYSAVSDIYCTARDGWYTLFFYFRQGLVSCFQLLSSIVMNNGWLWIFIPMYREMVTGNQVRIK